MLLTIHVLFLLSSLCSIALASFPSWSLSSSNTYMVWNELPQHDIQLRILQPNNNDTLTEQESFDLWIIGRNNQTSTPAVSTLIERLDAAFNGSISRIQQQSENFTTAATHTNANYISAQQNTKALYMYTGNQTTDARKVGTALASLVTAEKCQNCAFIVPNLQNLTVEYLQELVTCFWLGLYKDERFKGCTASKEEEKATPVRLDLIVEHTPEQQDVMSTKALQTAKTIAAGIYLSRDIVNAPHNVLNSLALADTAKRLAQQYKTLSCRTLTHWDCERKGMGAFLGVARGAETPPVFLHLTYRPRKAYGRLKKIGIVGKGLLMDTGGYNIKTTNMEVMKGDCGGAAAVLGAARAIAELEPPGVEVHFCIAACENMISDRAYVPGDILTASNGKTIEVLNTDAEGRLTMADALVYVDQELNCDEIVELSTLTGACVVALGNSVAGLFSRYDDLVSDLLEASQTSGEKLWRMPMEGDYMEQLKSKIADLKNIGGRGGGAITAALFLQNFVDDGRPFAHIDMAGPGIDFKEGSATGWGAKLLTTFVCNQSKKLPPK